MPSIIEQQDQIMGLPMEVLVNYAQNPSGALPLYLVLERIRDLTGQRKKHLASQNQRPGTIFDQSIEEATAPQGIGALQPQMPPQMQPQMPPQMSPGASGGAMPPSNAMQQPPMPPEMISAQMNAQSQMMAATGGRMPYPAMAGGGMVPPNSLVEDASKFNPQSMYDMDPSQMAMAKPTNMGIASVLPMSGGGVVRMQGGEQVPDNFVSMNNLPGGMTREKFQGLSPEQQNRYLQSIEDRGSLVRGTKALLYPPALLYDKVVLNPLKAASEITGLGDYFGGRIARALPFADKTKPTAFEGPQRYDESINMLQNWMDRTLSSEDVGKYLSSTESTDSQGQDLANGISSVDPRNELVGPPETRRGEAQAVVVPENVRGSENDLVGPPAPDEGSNYRNLVENLEVTGAPDVPVLQTGKVTPDEVGVREISGLSDLVTPDQDTELKTARERLTGLMGQEVKPYDPTELLLKSQERADQRAINQALINFGAGIARGDAASGLEKAGESVASIKDRQELLEQQLQTRRGEAQVQAQKDQIARDIAIAQADIGAIESDKDYQDKLIGRQLQYEGLLLDARTAGNDASIKQFTAQLAANKFLQDQSEFNRTLDANLNEQEQLNYRAQLATLNKAFEDVSAEIIRRNMYATEKGQDAPSWSEIEKELEAARVRIFGQIVALKDQGTGWELPENLRNTGSGEIQIISSRP
jgi:hypothetical protein